MTGKYFTDDKISKICSDILLTSNVIDNVIKDLGTIAENSNLSLDLLRALNDRRKLMELKHVLAQMADMFIPDSIYPSEGENQ